MALRTPPSWLQQGSHSAENDRLSMQALFATSGVMGQTSMAVTQNGAGAMNVNVASGWCAIVGNYQSNMGVYQAYNDATTNLTITTADTTNPRIDRVVVTISDAYYTGLTNTVAFQVLAGTPAASPTAPSTPTNSISLATIAVAANASTILTANITDTRTFATSEAFVSPVGDNFFAGTSTLAPYKLTSGSALTTVQPGAHEYDGAVEYFTPNASATNTREGGRGIVQTSHIYNLTSDRSLTTGSTSAQSLFGVGFYGSAGAAYEVEVIARLQYAVSAPSVAVTYTLNPSTTPVQTTMTFDYTNNTTSFSTATASNRAFSNSLPPSVSIASGTSASTYYVTFSSKGIWKPAASGANQNLTPQLTFGAATYTSATIGAGSYIKVTPLGSGSMVSVGAWA